MLCSSVTRQWGNTTSEIDRNTTKTYPHNIAINEWLCGVAAYAWPTVGSYPLIAMSGDKNGYTLGAQNDLNNSGPLYVTIHRNMQVRAFCYLPYANQLNPYPVVPLLYNPKPVKFAPAITAVF